MGQSKTLDPQIGYLFGVSTWILQECFIKYIYKKSFERSKIQGKNNKNFKKLLLLKFIKIINV